MSDVSSDATTATTKNPRQWGIIASLAAYVMALIAPSYALLPFVFGLNNLPLGANLKTAIELILYMLMEFGVVLLALMAYGRKLGSIGFTKVRWRYAAKAVAGYIAYFCIYIVVFQIAVIYFHIDQSQPQNIGYASPSGLLELALAFIQIVLLTPLVEESLFRGYMFTGLRSKLPFAATALLVSGLFALAHGQWNVGIDVFVMSMVSCYLREKEQSLWPSIFLHVLKNGVAFYLLYLYTGG